MVEFYFSQMANKYCSDLNIYEEDDFREAIITVKIPLISSPITSF